MYRPAVVFGLYLSFAIAVGAACSNGAPQVPSDDDSFTPPGQTGGANSGAGMTGTGGSFMPTGGAGGSVTASGGAGGTVASGGAGGTVSSGGKSGGGTTGGTTGVAGHSTGGSSTGGTGGSTGGTTSAGGTSSGTAGTGTGSGGTMTGAAGTSSGGVTCDTAFTVGMDGFVRMPAKDGSCWHGYAYASGDSCSAGTCTGTTTISYCMQTGAKDFTKCMGMLSISGTLNSADSTNMYAGYVLIGFSTNQSGGSDTKGTVKPTGTGLVVTGTAASGRVQIQNGSTYYCAPFTSGMLIPYTSFNTKCYDSPPDGTAYAAGGPIDTIALEIPGGAMSADYTISLLSVKEM